MTGELVYYKDKREYEIQHIIRLQQIHSISRIYYSKTHINCIGLVTTECEKSRLYILDGETSENVTLWIDALYEVASNLERQIQQYIFDLSGFYSNVYNTNASQTSSLDRNIRPAFTVMEDLEKSWWDEALRYIVSTSDKNNWKTLSVRKDIVEGKFPEEKASPHNLIQTDESKQSNCKSIENELHVDSDFDQRDAGAPSCIVGDNFPSVTFSPFLTPLSENVPFFSSFLLKKNDMKNKQEEWTNRWFVIRGTALMRYRDQNEYELIDMVHCRDIVDIVPFFDKPKDNRNSKIKLIPIERVESLFNEFCLKVESILSTSQDIEQVKLWKTQLWENFRLEADTVLFLVELIMLNKKNVILSTHDPEIFERFMTEIKRSWLLSQLSK